MLLPEHAMKGCNIHSFETFGLVDGPGVRFVVFVPGLQRKIRYSALRKYLIRLYDISHIGMIMVVLL